MSFLHRLFCVVCLSLCAVFATIAMLVAHGHAAPSPGSILPEYGPAHDELVNQMPPPPQGGREGYMGTHTDPATGDVITDIVSPRAPQQQQQQTPIIVYPQVGSPYAPLPYGGGSQGMQPGQGGMFVPGASGGRPHSRRSPNLPGNRVQHPGLSLPGGNPGNMGHYGAARPGGRP